MIIIVIYIISGKLKVTLIIKILHSLFPLNIEEGKRRTCRKQVHRDNHDVETVSEHFKKSLTLPIIDHLKFSLE